MQAQGQAISSDARTTTVQRMSPCSLKTSSLRQPGIFIVVPVHNRKNLTERFIDCLHKQTFQNFTLVVVDDGSTDGTSDLIEDKFPTVHLIRGDGTLWWTGGINAGIRHALALANADDAVLVINDDLEVDTDYLASLYRLWQAVPDSLIGSVVVDFNSPERIVDGGRRVNWWTAKFRILNRGKKLTDFHRRHCEDVSLLTGWGTLIPVKVFHEIGLFDDRHFQQCGDTELPVRAKNIGYRLIVGYACVVKVHMDASDDVNLSEHYSLRDLRKYFFDVKSNSRLKYRFFFAYNTARNPLMFVSFLSSDLLRISIHFLRRLSVFHNGKNRR